MSIKGFKSIICENMNFLNPFYRLPTKGEDDLFTFFSSEGYLCPGINILGNFYNIDSPFGTLDSKDNIY